MPVRWVEDLFARLSAILGGAMSNVYASADPELVKAEWAEALAGFSAEEVKRGLAGCRTRKFAPNLGEFLHLCRPALDPEFAWIEAEKGLRSFTDGTPFDWSHPAVYWAARGMAYDIRTGSFERMRKRWEAALREQFGAGYWASPPDPSAKRLAQQAQGNELAPSRREHVADQLRSLRERMTGYPSKADEEAALRSAEEAALQDPRT